MRKLIASSLLALTLVGVTGNVADAGPRPQKQIKTAPVRPQVALDPECFADGMRLLWALWEEEIITTGELVHGAGNLQETCEV